MLRSFLSPGASDRVVDLGCGSGRTLLWNRDWGSTMVGIDISPVLRRGGARGRRPPARRPAQAAVRRRRPSPRRTRSTCSSTCRPKRCKGMLAEAARVLAPGGGALRLHARAEERADRGRAALDQRAGAAARTARTHRHAAGAACASPTTSTRCATSRSSRPSPRDAGFRIGEDPLLHADRRRLRREHPDADGRARDGAARGRGALPAQRRRRTWTREAIRAARTSAKQRIAASPTTHAALRALSAAMKLDLLLFGRIKSGPFFALLVKDVIRGRAHPLLRHRPDRAGHARRIRPRDGGGGGAGALGHEVTALVTPGTARFPDGPVHWVAMPPPFGTKELRWTRARRRGAHRARVQAGRHHRAVLQLRRRGDSRRAVGRRGHDARGQRAGHRLRRLAEARLDRALLVEPMRRWRERICAQADLIVTPSADDPARADTAGERCSSSNGAPTPTGSTPVPSAAVPFTRPPGDGRASSPAPSAAGTARSISSRAIRRLRERGARRHRGRVHRRRTRAAGACGTRPPDSTTSCSPARCRTTGCRRPRRRRHRRRAVRRRRPSAAGARVLLVAAEDLRVHGQPACRSSRRRSTGLPRSSSTVARDCSTIRVAAGSARRRARTARWT